MTGHIDVCWPLGYAVVMKKALLTSSVVLISLSMGGVAYACDMHGGGFGAFGMDAASWKTYTPRMSMTDPAQADRTLVTPVKIETQKKTKPSFSNVASIAAAKAKARLARKESRKDAVKKVDVKTKVLNADR